MRSIKIERSQNFFLQPTDTEITITSGNAARVIIYSGTNYTIRGLQQYTLLPNSEVTLILSGKNWIVYSPSTTLKVISVFRRSGDVVALSGDYNAGQISYDGISPSNASNVEDALDELYSEKQAYSEKDESDGYVGLTLFKINFKNALNTFTSFFTNSNTVARTYTFPNKSGTVAMTSDIPSPTSLVNVLGSTSGSADFSMSVQETAYKHVVIYMNILVGAASYAFPTPFTHTPQILCDNAPRIATVTSLSTTAVTITGAGETGFIELSGF